MSDPLYHAVDGEHTCKCGTRFCKHHKAQVWSCGGGTQSVAIAVLIIQEKLPKPDISVIVDTTRETSATWEYCQQVLCPELAKVGVNLIRIDCNEWNKKRAGLWCDYVDGRPSDLRIPAYSTREGPKAKLDNHCTGRWKVEPRNRFLSKENNLTRSRFVCWIGFSVDEPLRWMKMMKGKEYQKGLVRFPLVHDVRMTRYECKLLIKKMGWPSPPRSACWMCPNHDDDEWRKLRLERPEEFRKAVEFEKEIQKRDPDAWLHRSCIPLDQVDFSQPEDLFSRPCDSGVCFV